MRPSLGSVLSGDVRGSLRICLLMAACAAAFSASTAAAPATGPAGGLPSSSASLAVSASKTSTGRIESGPRRTRVQSRRVSPSCRTRRSRPRSTSPCGTRPRSSDTGEIDSAREPSRPRSTARLGARRTRRLSASSGGRSATTRSWSPNAWCGPNSRLGASTSATPTTAPFTEPPRRTSTPGGVASEPTGNARCRWSGPTCCRRERCRRLARTTPGRSRRDSHRLPCRAPNSPRCGPEPR